MSIETAISAIAMGAESQRLAVDRCRACVMVNSSHPVRAVGGVERLFTLWIASRDVSSRPS
ncbi:MAG TPA: hypothetical protein VF253_10920 [Candidatus Limnocylindrales bacterium]